jgi:prepilin-type N-terminal cleavage/methylation domain-containing protein
MNRIPCASDGGFTLLEVLISLTILGIAVAVVIQLSSSNTRSIMISDDYSKSVLTAEAKMRDLLDKPSLSEGEWSEQTDDGYRINYLVTDMLAERTVNLPLKMLRIEVALKYMSGSKPLSVRLRSVKLIEKPVMEDNATAKKQ